LSFDLALAVVSFLLAATYASSARRIDAGQGQTFPASLDPDAIPEGAAPRGGQPAKMADSPTVDAVLHNAVIVTMDGALRVLREGALAVSGDRIAAVGSSADVLASFPCAVQTVDLGGRIVLPGRCLAACSSA